MNKDINSWIPFNRENATKYDYSGLANKGNLLLKFDDGEVCNYNEEELPFAEVTHFKPKS